jgi:hypothetical protein
VVPYDCFLEQQKELRYRRHGLPPERSLTALCWYCTASAPTLHTRLGHDAGTAGKFLVGHYRGIDISALAARDRDAWDD